MQSQNSNSSVPKVFIVILNWNGWGDTIECLESIFRLRYANYRVIVCDNDSSDGSVDKIKAWANGQLDVVVPKDATLRNLTHPPIPKPIPYEEYDRRETEIGSDPTKDPSLVIINTGANLGYAGGNNVGVRYALQDTSGSFIWLLNNDTIADPAALDKLYERMAKQPDVGICGSSLLYYNEPSLIQAAGGCYYYPLIGIARTAFKRVPYVHLNKPDKIEEKLGYVTGASMLVRRELFEAVGLLGEDYFLFYEEIDLAVRARNYFSLGYASDSLIYHKIGRSTGSALTANNRSATAEFYLFRGRIRFTKKFYRYALPTVYLGLLFTMALRALVGKWDRVAIIWQILISGGTASIPGSQNS